MEEVQKNENGTTVPQADGKPKKEDKPKRELTPQQVQQRRKMICLLYTSPSPRDKRQSRMPSSA